MSEEEFLKVQTCVLKVDMHCDGCEDQVEKILQNIDGVYTTNIDAEQGKVTVSGTVDPAKLIKKLAKSGKHAEIWGAKPSNNNQNHLSNQFKNMQIDNGKGGNMGQKGGGKQLQQMKGFQDLKLKMPFKAPTNQNQNNQKAVNFKLPEDDDITDVDLDDFDDDDDDFNSDDEFDDDMDDLHHPFNKMKPIMGNGPQVPKMMMNPQLINAQTKNGGSGGPNGGVNSKKGFGNNGGGPVPVQINGNGGKKGGGGGGNGYNNGRNQNHGGGSVKNGGVQPMNKFPHGFQNMGGGGGMGQMGNVNKPMSHMGQMGNMAVGGQMGNMPAVQGLPAGAMNGGGGGGYFQGAGPEVMAGNPYQHQFAVPMMNQQRAMGNERFQPMMYARPPPPVNYMPPYPNPNPNPNPNPYPYPYQHPQPQHLPFKAPPNQNQNNQKAVKLKPFEDDDMTDDDEDFDDDVDDMDDLHHPVNKMKPIMGNGSRDPNMMNPQLMNGQAKNGGSGGPNGWANSKKGGSSSSSSSSGGDALPVQINGTGVKKGGGGGGNGNNNGGNQNQKRKLDFLDDLDSLLTTEELTTEKSKEVLQSTEPKLTSDEAEKAKKILIKFAFQDLESVGDHSEEIFEAIDNLTTIGDPSFPNFNSMKEDLQKYFMKAETAKKKIADVSEAEKELDDLQTKARQTMTEYHQRKDAIVSQVQRMKTIEEKITEEEKKLAELKLSLVNVKFQMEKTEQLQQRDLHLLQDMRMKAKVLVAKEDEWEKLKVEAAKELKNSNDQWKKLVSSLL